jgi:hypothetical protein
MSIVVNKRAVEVPRRQVWYRASFVARIVTERPAVNYNHFPLSPSQTGASKKREIKPTRILYNN